MPQLLMPLYVSPDDVILRMQLQGQLSGVKELISSAIVGAQLHVEACIGSKLQVIAQDDLFLCDSDAFSGIQAGGTYRLELSSGWVRSDQPVTITWDTDWKMPNPSTADPATYKIDYERGYVLMDAHLYCDKYVRVQCTTGFLGNIPTPALPNAPTVYDPTVQYHVNDAVTYAGSTFICILQPPLATLPNVVTYWTPVVFGAEQIPNDLYEGIVSDIPPVLNSDESTNRSEQAQKQYKALSDHTQMLLKKYFRLKGFSFRPVGA